MEDQIEADILIIVGSEAEDDTWIAWATACYLDGQIVNG